MSEPIDLLLHARWLVPIEPDDRVLEHHSVAIHAGQIVAVLPRADAERRYNATLVHALDNHILLPGLVNTHTHAAMTLLRGIADDLPLLEWLRTAIWPLEQRHVSPAFVRDGTLLAAAEMLAGGITTCNDMYFYPDAAAEAFDAAGMRAVVGLIVVDQPTAYATDAADYLRKGLEVRARWHDHPRLHFALAPHAPYTVADDTLAHLATLSAELDMLVHIHVHETADEIEQSLKQYGERPLARLERLGLLTPSMLGVHAVHLDSSDIARLQRHDVRLSHCPVSNMKLASGISPVIALQHAGLTVGLGTDGAASNNRLDLFQEMRQVALLAKVSTGDAAALPARTALRMATLDGARALGLDTTIGSIVPGKKADLCAVTLESTCLQPCFDPVSHLVFVCGREHVSHVWVEGELRAMGGNALLQCSNSELLHLAALWHHKLVSK